MSKKKRTRYYHPRRPVVQFPADFWSDPEALVTFLRSFYALGSKTPIFLDDALTMLEGLDTRLLHEKHSGAVLLGRVLLILVPLIDTRHRQHKRALGGKDRPLDFDLAELEQTLPDQHRLPTRLGALCKWLLDDLWTLLRLVRAARDLYRRGRQAWRQIHRLIGIVLLRILRLWNQLCRFHTPWVAYRCLRWALREVWGTLFGTPVALTRAAQPFLKLEALTLGQEWEMWWRLKKEHEAGATEVPGLCEPMMTAWLNGDLPPPYEGADMEEVLDRFWL
jgi:hypothetical protein